MSGEYSDFIAMLQAHTYVKNTSYSNLKENPDAYPLIDFTDLSQDWQK